MSDERHAQADDQVRKVEAKLPINGPHLRNQMLDQLSPDPSYGKRMTLKPMLWSGHAFDLCVRRHWNAFFGYTPFCEIRALRSNHVLPQGAGYHFQELYDLADGARDYFDGFDNFWSFSRKLCDQYCDFYVMERPRNRNTFDEFHSTYINDRTAVQNYAKASRGYIGPDEWKLS